MTQSSASAPIEPSFAELIKNPRFAPIAGVVIALATLLAYAPAIRGNFIWDDDYYVSHNRLLLNIDGLQRIWFGVLPQPADYALPQYYPLTYTSFWLEFRLWGLNPAGYHVVNVILHICSALLIWLILKKLSVPGAWLAAAIFALHPINVESVAWIAERKNVLSSLFFLSSLYVYLRYAGIIGGAPAKIESLPSDSPQTNQIELFKLPDDPARLYALTTVLFLCALFSKTVTSSMPAVALLIIWWKRGRISVKDVLPSLPLFVVGFLAGMLTAYMERVRVGIALRPQDWIYAPTALGQFGAKCIIAGRVIWFYLGKLLFPYPLIFNYARWEIHPGNPLEYFFPASVIVVLLVIALSRKRLGNGVLVAVVFYLVTLFPAMGFVDVWPMRYSFVADHFVYLSEIGLIALIAAILAKYLSRPVFAGVATVVLALFFGMSFHQGEIYTSLPTLWRDTINKTQQRSWFAMNNYGVWIRDKSEFPVDPYARLDVAERWFKRVIEVKHDHPEARFNLAIVAEQRAALAKMAQNDLVPITTQPGDYQQQAVDYFLEALKYDPNYIDARYFLGRLYLAMGNENDAVEQFRKIVELRPNHDLAHEELGMIAMQRGKIDEAIAEFYLAVQSSPDWIQGHKQLGGALLQKGDLVNGLAEWDEAMRLAPTDWTLPNEFGVKMAAANEDAKAVSYFQKALEINPQAVEVIVNLGIIAAKEDFPDRAEALFNQALKIDPQFAKAKQELNDLKAGKIHPTTQRTSAQSTTLQSQ
jgi:Tfp pilus assembly protein PilF